MSERSGSPAGVARVGGAALLLALLCGCASDIPRAIREAPADAVTLAQVREDPARYRGRQIRWGGTIIVVNNRPETTDIEVLDRPLDWEGAPRTGREGRGRFIARVPGFVDPAEYQKDRSLTVAGTLAGVETRPVGDYPYAYPVVSVEARHLWPKEPPPGAWYPYGYPGWYGPWGPWGPGFDAWGPGWWGPVPPPRRPYYGPGPGPRPGPGPGPGPRPGLWNR